MENKITKILDTYLIGNDINIADIIIDYISGKCMDCKQKFMIDDLQEVSYIECCESDENCKCGDWEKKYLICKECLPYNCCSECDDLLCKNEDHYEIVECDRCERIFCEDCEYEGMKRCNECEENICCETMWFVSMGDQSFYNCDKCNNCGEDDAEYEPLPKRC